MNQRPAAFRADALLQTYSTRNIHAPPACSLIERFSGGSRLEAGSGSGLMLEKTPPTVKSLAAAGGRRYFCLLFTAELETEAGQGPRDTHDSMAFWSRGKGHT